jgi:hypothetical protein
MVRGSATWKWWYKSVETNIFIEIVGKRQLYNNSVGAESECRSILKQSSLATAQPERRAIIKRESCAMLAV